MKVIQEWVHFSNKLSISTSVPNKRSLFRIIMVWFFCCSCLVITCLEKIYIFLFEINEACWDSGAPLETCHSWKNNQTKQFSTNNLKFPPNPRDLLRKLHQWQARSLSRTGLGAKFRSSNSKQKHLKNRHFLWILYIDETLERNLLTALRKMKRKKASKLVNKIIMPCTS